MAKFDKKVEWQKFSVRSDRKPRDMPKDLHNLLDKTFLEMFGWKARSEGVFVTSGATWEGEKDSLFFPIGKFKYIWSPRINDLYMEERTIKMDMKHRTVKEQLIQMVKLLTMWKYTDKDMVKNETGE